MDYVVNHNYAVKAIMAIPQPGLVAFIAACAALGSLLCARRKKDPDGKGVSISYRGILAYLAVQLFCSAVIVAFSAGPYLKGISGFGRAAYFFGYSTLFVGGLFIILTAAYCLGSILTTPLKHKTEAGHSILSIAFGFSLLGLPLVLLGLADAFNVYTCWGLILAALAIRWRTALTFLTETLWTKRSLTFATWWSPAVLVLLLAVTGYNLVAAFKTFPIGYDGGALYVNLANLVADTGGLPYGGQAYGWSLMMALGQTLFGNLSVAILMSHLMNVLCVLIVYRLARLWLSNDGALLSALIPLLSPYFAFHGIVDEKIDLAFAFVILAGIYLAALTLRQAQRGPLVQRNAPGESKAMKLPLVNRSLNLDTYTFLLLGWLAGYAFTIKYTAILYIFALTIWLFHRYGGKWAYLAAVALTLGFIFLSDISRFGYLDLSGTEKIMLGAGLFLSGSIGLWYAYKDNLRALSLPLIKTGLMALTFLLAFSPWAAKNIFENGSFGVSTMLEGLDKKPPLNFIPSLSQRTPRNSFRPMLTSYEQPVDQQPTAKFVLQQPSSQRDGKNATDQAAREEIQRYLGYEQYFWRYASLPNDLNTGANIRNSRYVDPGFLFLLFLPILLFATGRSRPPLWRGVLFMMVMLIALAGSYYAIYASPTGLFTTDTAWDQLQNTIAGNGTPAWLIGLHGLITRPVFALTGLLSPVFFLIGDLTLWATLLIIFGVFFLAALSARRQFIGASPGLSGFVGFLATYALLWWILGNGILWYAMPLFIAAPIVVLSFLEKPAHLLGEDLQNFSRYFCGGVLSLFVLLFTLQYFNSQYPGEQDAANILRSPFVEVSTDPSRLASRAISKFNPVITDALRIMNADPSSNIYRVNTHYGFLITENDTRVYTDPTLERYAQITDQLTDNSQFFDMLKVQGYRYILLDLRTATLDITPEKSLTQKFISIARELTSSPKVRVLVTDNYVADPAAPAIRLPNGSSANARFGIDGQTVSLGNIALFEIL